MLGNALKKQYLCNVVKKIPSLYQLRTKSIHTPRNMVLRGKRGREKGATSSAPTARKEHRKVRQERIHFMFYNLILKKGTRLWEKLDKVSLAVSMGPWEQ